MDDMHRESTGSDDSAMVDVDRSEQPAAAVRAAARLLANPRRVRRA